MHRLKIVNEQAFVLYSGSGLEPRARSLSGLQATDVASRDRKVAEFIHAYTGHKRVTRGNVSVFWDTALQAILYVS